VQIDLISVLPSILVALVGWLVSRSVKEVDRKLEKYGTKTEDHGDRLIALETYVTGYPPTRRKTDKQPSHSGE